MSENVEKSEFLSGISHEIRTVLNTIVGLSEDISEYESLPEEIMEDAEDLRTSSKTLFELIDNILDFMMIDTNNMKTVNSVYNPKELFESCSNIDESDFDDKPIDLHTNISPDLPYELIGDKSHITKIVRNLLSNAIKYTDGGDIWFDVKCINNVDTCNLTISVKDTGCGMTPEETENLFAKIERLFVDKTNRKKGTGLGLAVVKSLIDMLGGEITVESTYGEGSTFTVSFSQKINLMEEPDLSKTQRLKLQEINYDKEGYGYKKVLVVDDNELNIKVVRRILEQFDLIIDECHDGQECIDMVLDDGDYDLILMDIMMPGMSGEETLKKLREITGFDTPVIALTAEAEAGSEEKYKEEGFAGYLAKPFSKTQIEETIDKVFKQKEILEDDFDDEFEEEDLW